MLNFPIFSFRTVSLKFEISKNYKGGNVAETGHTLHSLTRSLPYTNKQLMRCWNRNKKASRAKHQNHNGAVEENSFIQLLIKWDWTLLYLSAMHNMNQHTNTPNQKEKKKTNFCVAIARSLNRSKSSDGHLLFELLNALIIFLFRKLEHCNVQHAELLFTSSTRVKQYTCKPKTTY